MKDLKRRGLLDSTLVFWGAEFGRSPESQGSKGRDHHNLGFSMWLAAALKADKWWAQPTPSACTPSTIPATCATIHTTILNQLGMNQDALSYLHQGRKERLTEIHGNVIQQIV